MAIRYLSGINVDSNTLFVDDVNNRVGIGTASPSQKLHVVGKGLISNAGITGTPSWSNNSFEIQSSSGQIVSLEFHRAGFTSSQIWSDGNNLIFGNSSGTERMRIQDGSVGIGTTSPGAKLDVNGSIQAGSGNTFGTGSNGASIYMSSASGLGLSGNLSGYSRNLIKTDGASVIEIGDTGTSLISAINISAGDAAGAIALKTGGNNTRLYVNSSGNVGIGTTSPAQKLEVVGVTRLTDTNSIPLELNRGLDVDSVGPAGVGMSFGTLKTGVYKPGAFIFGTLASNGTDGTFGIQTRVGDVLTTKLTITAAGAAGIGTTAPDSLLHISGSGNTFTRYTNTTSAGHYIDIGANGAGQSFVYGYGAYPLLFGTNGSEAMRITSAGNVGIGATDPLRKLHVVGNFAVNAGTGQYYGVNITGGEGTNPNILIGDWHNASANLTWDSTNRLLRIDAQYSTSGAPIVFSGNDAALEYARFTAIGNFGIGTTAPSYKLDVESSSGLIETIRVKNGYTGGSDGAQLLLGNSANFTNAYFRLNGGGNSSQAGIGSLNIGLTVSAPMAFYTADTERMRITAAGNVGIGTTAPGYKLTVNGDVDVNNGAILAAQPYGINLGVSGYDIVMPATTRIAIKTEASERISILNTGNVGIGTTSPDALLEISGNAGADPGPVTNPITFRITDAGNAATGLGDTTNPWGRIQFYSEDQSSGGPSVQAQIASIYGNIYSSSSHLVFYTQAVPSTGIVERMRILDTGNVGIGTASPSQKLHVSGNVRVTGAYYDSNNSAGSSGQVLSSTGSGTDWVSLSEISGVDGTGTANYVAKWSDADTIANSQLFDNGTNVGIGTTSPNAKLQVVGTMSASNIISNNSSSNGTTVLAYQDQFKQVWTTLTSFSLTGAGVYYFNLVFTTNQGFTYDLTATTSREGLWRNFGALRDNSYLNVESDGDFETHAVGDVQIISNDMYLDAPPTAFKSATTTASGVNGTSPWAYYIVRYAVYIPTYAGNTDGFFKVHLTTYGYTGSAPLFINA
jgi:hypothetical protein